jgi:hypothetical protein
MLDGFLLPVVAFPLSFVRDNFRAREFGCSLCGYFVVGRRSLFSLFVFLLSLFSYYLSNDVFRFSVVCIR